MSTTPTPVAVATDEKTAARLKNGSDKEAGRGQSGRVEKRRHYVRHGAHLWEVDEFEGDNAGLVVHQAHQDHRTGAVNPPCATGPDTSGTLSPVRSTRAR